MNRLPWFLVAVTLLAGCAATGEVPLDAERAPPLKSELSGEEQIGFLLEFGALLLEQRRLTEAERVVEDLRRQAPDSVEALRLLAQLHEALDRPGLALLAWEQVHRRNADDIDDAAEYARIALLNGHYAVAETIYEAWLAGAAPDSRRALAARNNLGYSRLLQKRPEEAREHLEAALAIDPLNRRARANLVLAFRLEGREAEAKEQVELLGFDPGAPGW